MLSRQFFLFILAGGLAAGVNFGSRILLSQWFDYVPAIVLAYLLGMATAFLLNRLFVFNEAKNAIHHQALWFAAVNLAAVVQTLAVSLALAKWLLPAAGITTHAEAIAHSAGVVVPVVTSYFGHKRLSFA